MSGRVTADEINCDLWTAKGSKLWRIACLTFLGFLTVAGLFFTLAPMPAHADEDKDRHREREDNDRGIRAEITALQAQVAALQSAVSTLQTANSDQQNEIKSLQTSNAKLQNQVNSLQTSNITMQKQLAAVQSNHALLLGPFVNVDPNPEIGVRGPNIVFSGANIHIVSGSGSTNDNGNPTGLGNLIIGYDEDPAIPPEGPASPSIPLKPGDRGGSHNLILGDRNRFTQTAFGGLVTGQFNTISNQEASVVCGLLNTASGRWACVSGGEVNTASGPEASVSGGVFNIAGGTLTVVIGGQNVIDNNDNSIAPKPPFP